MSIHVEVIVVRAGHIVVNDCSRWNVVRSTDTVLLVLTEKFDIVTSLDREHCYIWLVVFLNPSDALTQHGHFKLDDFVVLALGQPIAEVDDCMGLLALGGLVEVFQRLVNKGVQIMNKENILAFLLYGFRDYSSFAVNR